MISVKRIGGEENRYSAPKNPEPRISRGKLNMAVYCIVMLFLIFSSISIRLSYNEKTESMNKEIARVKARIHILNREISNRKMQRESLRSWKVIRGKIQAYRMGLRSSEYGQVRKITLKGSGRRDSSYSGDNVKYSMR